MCLEFGEYNFSLVNFNIFCASFRIFPEEMGFKRLFWSRNASALITVCNQYAITNMFQCFMQRLSDRVNYSTRFINRILNFKIYNHFFFFFIENVWSVWFSLSRWENTTNSYRRKRSPSLVTAVAQYSFGTSLQTNKTRGYAPRHEMFKLS